MILYFSGTGNSAYAAKYIGEQIGDDVVDLFPRIRGKDHSRLTSEKPWVVVAPVYCWQLPRIVRDWMLQTELAGSREVYFVLTCGGNMGNAGKYLKLLCQKIDLAYKGCMEVVMPENYIALFDAPDREKSLQIIHAAEHVLQKAADRIKGRQAFAEKKAGPLGSINSSIVNQIYYPLIVKDKKFYGTDACNGCGLCQQKCPLNNIRIAGGKPIWNGNCTHCMACISYCPQEAIEYGDASKGKTRYICPK